MKTIRGLLVVLTVAGVMMAVESLGQLPPAKVQAEPAVFEVSKVGKDKAQLIALYEAVAEGEEVKGMKFRVIQRVGEKRYLATFEFEHRVVTNRTGKASVDTVYKTSNPYLVVVKEEPEGGYADKHWIKEATYKKTGKVYRYKTVTGAEAGVEIYEEVPKKDPMTKKEFVERLKKGETFDVTLQESAKCKTCYGAGRVDPGNRRKKEADGKAKCTACKGKGKVSVSQSYLVKW